tara:strand:+ start:219 stop:359 length:141 start_codon:yes stop_codon:yes gene_type:complete
MVCLISKAFGILAPTHLSPDLQTPYLQNSVSKKSIPLMKQKELSKK